MAYDDKLAERVRTAIGKKRGLTEKKMFGGLGFMLNGNLVCGVSDRGLLLRVEPGDTDKVLAMKHVMEFVMKGRPPMKGWVRVHEDGLGTAAQVKKWVAMGVAYAGSLPPK